MCGGGNSHRPIPVIEKDLELPFVELKKLKRLGAVLAIKKGVCKANDL